MATHSCLENSVDRGAWWAVVHGVTQSWTQLKQLSMHACIGLCLCCHRGAPGNHQDWVSTIIPVETSS